MNMFAQGQVWTIRDAPAPETRIVVGRVDGAASVVHVSVTDVPVPEHLAPGAPRITIAHAPFGQAALAASVLGLERAGAAPVEGFAEAYAEWAAEEEGCYSIGVRESIDQIFAALAADEA